MRLHQHDDIAKDTARKAYEAEPSWFGKPTWDGLEREHQNALELEARRYIDAMLEAVVKLGGGEVSDVEFTGDAHTQAALFLKLEPKP
jgi:hypothetical protein